MKKLICIILIVLLIMPACFIPVTAFAKKDDFLVAKSYNNLATGAAEGFGARVVVTKENSNKALELSGFDGESNIYYEASPENDVTVSMYVDLEYKTKTNYTKFYITGTAGKEYTLAYINDNGEICSGDSRLATGVPKNRSTSVQISYNTFRKKVSIRMGGKSLVANRYLGDSAPDTVTGFGINVKAEQGNSCIADNFAIFEGSRLLKSSDIPKTSYSNESALPQISTSDAAPGETEEFIGDTVFVNRTFDEEGIPELEKITLNSKLNTIEMDKSVFDGNKYLKLTKTDAEESFIAFGASQSARYVIMEVDLSTDTNAPGGRIVVRDGEAAKMFCTLANISANGDITTTDGRFIAKIEPLKWVKLAMFFNMNTLTMDIFVGGELIYKDIPFDNQFLTGMPLLRVYCDKKVNTGTLLVDNIKTYEGKEIRDISKAERKSKVTPDSVAQGYIGNGKAIQPYVSTYYTDNTKYDSPHKMILENEDTIAYVHEEELKHMFGSALVLKNPHLTQPGYYDALATAKENGYYIQTMDTRLHIFSKTPINLAEDRMAEVQRYMFNVRPTAEELLELYKNSDNYQKHPRIMIDAEELERIKSLCKTDPHMKKWAQNVIKAADATFGADDYTYPLTRSSMDQVDLALDDVSNLCLAYHLTGSERYVHRTWRILKGICDLPNWNPYGYLDVGEMSFIVGMGYDWLYHQWTPEQRKYLEDSIYKKGTHLTYRLYYGELDYITFINNLGEVSEYYTGWWDSENNWGGVCNGGTMLGAMAILDVYPEVASDMIENANRALEYMVTSYYPEGAWSEGGGYWRYALSYLVRTIMTFQNTFGTDFNITKAPGLDGTGWYGTRLMGSTGLYTIGDTVGGFINNPHIMWCAREYGDKELMAMRMQEFEKLGLEAGYNELLYYDPTLLEGGVAPPLDTFMDGMDVIALREAWYDTGTTFVGASGGKNGRGHGHYDTGSFQIDMAGERFICDIGAEDYGAPGGYFTVNRYLFYRSRPEGHNMYIINPENDNLEYFGVVPESRADGQILVSKPRGAIAEMDLSEIYEPWVTSAKRGFMLSDDRRSVTVRDEIDLKKPNSEIYYSLHTYAKVEKFSENQVVLTLNGKKMLITIETNGTNVSIEEAEAATISNVTSTLVSDSNNMSRGARKVVIRLTGTGRVNITLKFKQFDDEMVDSNPVEGDISTWTIPDGEVTPLPAVDKIYVDGELIKDFDPKVTGYSYLVASKETVIPTVTVSTDLKYEITPAKDFGDDTIVKVYAKDSDSVYRVYRVNFWKKPPLQDVDGMRRYPIAEVTASAIPQEQNGPANTFDMDFATRWAAESTDVEPEHWIMFELDDVYPIEKIGVSWMSGTSRNYTYKLEISVDGENWTTVYDGISSGKEAKCEYTIIGGKKAKFIRYRGYGNTTNGWNSVTEVEILGNQR